METASLYPIGEYLLMAAGILYLIQIAYYLCLYNRIAMHARAVRRGNVHFSQELPPISVIIYAREELEHLRRNLASILAQDYPQFEVIVINDGESSESDDYLTLLEEKYPNLYHSFIPNSSRYISHKKLGITLGVKASRYDWLVLTDACCYPQSDQWLRLLARNFTSHTRIVLGYSGYERGKGWLHKQVSFDNLFSAMRYLGFALCGMPYMGIGRNLAYRKELFYEQKGFSAHLNLLRGDDDLFVNQTATSDNTRVETASEAVVRMQPVVRAQDWKEEKIGYASTARLYRGIQRYLAGFETTTRLLFHTTWMATTVVGIINQLWTSVIIAAALFLTRYGIQLFVINRTAGILNEKRRYYFTLPVFDLLQAMQSLKWKAYCLFRNKSNFMRK